MDDFETKIRSLIISYKGKYSLRQLESDYYFLLGEKIPYRQFGFKTLQDFIQNVPSLSLNKGPNGECCVEAKTSEKSAHIVKMINKQKSTKKSKQLPKYNKSFIKKAWRPQTVPAQKNYVPSTRPAKMMHKQIVNSPKVQVSAPSKIVNPISDGGNQQKLLDRLSIIKITKIDEECSPLRSTKKRLSQLGQSITLEDGDSGICTPSPELLPSDLNISCEIPLVRPQFTPPPPIIIEEFHATSDPIEDLKNFVRIHHLGEVTITSNAYKMKHKRMIIGKVTVGDKGTYSSYPEEFKAEAEAQRCAARKALDDLQSKHSTNNALAMSHVHDILDRVPLMLEKHPNGIWSWQLVSNYMDIYKEQLPENWLDIADASPVVSIEKFNGQYVLRHCKPEDKGQKWTTSISCTDVSVPSKTVTFGSDERLDAIVTSVVSAGEIWCQQCGTPEYNNFTSMIVKMEEFYMKHKMEYQADAVNVNSFYVVWKDEGFYRAKALELDGDGGDLVKFILIDFGYDDHIPKSDVYRLKREFAVDDAQAFVFRLVGLEELYEMSTCSEYLHDLLGKYVTLELTSEYANSDPLIPVVMYDEEGNSVNERLIELLPLLATPTLNQKIISDVFVTHLDNNGDIYVQIRNSQKYQHFVSLMNGLEQNIVQRPPAFLQGLTMQNGNNQSSKLYLIKHQNEWRRTRITNWIVPNGIVKMCHIDYGYVTVVDVRKDIVYPLSLLSDIINHYPAQAVKVRLSLEKNPINFVEEMNKFVKVHEAMILKVANPDADGAVPLVEIYARVNGIFLCINNSIAMEAEIKSKDDAVKVPSKRILNLKQFNETALSTVPSGGNLSEPTLPKKNEYFTVNVPFAVSPWNFFVQPLDTYDKLSELMVILQSRYNDRKFDSLKLETIVPGNIYASKFTDGRWYRTTVLKVINTNSISVCYCDFGYYTNLTVSQLVPLDQEFMTLPYQAMKAKLSGIKPKFNKWSVEDCEFFKQLVTKNQFVSVIRTVEKDELYRSDNVLSLILIDTTTNHDKYIHQELISRGIAIKD